MTFFGFKLTEAEAANGRKRNRIDASDSMNNLRANLVHRYNHINGKAAVIDGSDQMNFPQGNLVHRYSRINGKAAAFDGSDQMNFPQGNLVHCYNHNNGKAPIFNGSNQMNFPQENLVHRYNHNNGKSVFDGHLNPTVTTNYLDKIASSSTVFPPPWFVSYFFSSFFQLKMELFFSVNIFYTINVVII